MTWKITRESSNFLKFISKHKDIVSYITLEFNQDIGYSVNAHVIQINGDNRSLLYKNSAVFSDKNKALAFVNELKNKINKDYF